MISEAYARAFAEFVETLILDRPGYTAVPHPSANCAGFCVANAVGEMFYVWVNHLADDDAPTCRSAGCPNAEVSRS